MVLATIENPEASSEVEPRSRRLAPLCALVVEDDEAIRETVCEVLRMEGFAVTEATDGLDALEVLEAGPLPDVVVLDFMMPRMDGLEVLQHVRESERLRLLPIVVMTACGTFLVRCGAQLEDPRTLLIAKPFEVETMLAAISAVAPRASKTRLKR
jgi:CheY-like chemotaxis protein